MVCRLCLDDSVYSIQIFSEDKIQKYIEKYLQLKLTSADTVSTVICSNCWQQLNDFEEFCLRIEIAQKSLIAVLENDFKNDLQNVSTDVIDKEISSHLTNADESLEEFKEEACPQLSDDENPDDNYDTHSLDKDDVKNDSETHQPSETSITCTSDQIFTEIFPRRVTRGSKKRSLVEDKNDQQFVHEKRKRGRPKKGEEPVKKEKKERSERGNKILQTAKEFDEIIQKNMNLSCNICAVNVIDFAELKRHFRVVHNRRGYAICCNKRLFKRGLVVDHINTHINPEHFKCQDCGKVLADRMCLRNHVLLMHQTDDSKIFQCDYCPKKYAKQYLLDHHRVKHIPKEECTFFCSECERGFPTNSALTKHMHQIHWTTYDKMCEICAKLIRGNSAFERHMEEHEGIVRPQVQCDECGNWLKDKNSLRKHMYKHDGKTYSCNVCGKTTPSKSALYSHMRYVHQTERQFQCNYCDKSFKKAVNLREHLTTHTGEVLYTCPHCPKTFNSKANMHSHRKKKHRELWEANRRNLKKVTTVETS